MTQVAWRVCGVSFLGDIQKSPGHGPGHAALNGLAWADRLDHMGCGGPFQSQPFHDSENSFHSSCP